MFKKGIFIVVLLISYCFIEPKRGDAWTGIGTTLLETYRIGLAEARTWDSNANLTLIISVGSTSSNPQSTIGLDGRREVWNMIFTNGQRNATLILNIKRGKIAIKHAINDSAPGFEVISPEQLTLDSTEMVRIAKKHGLRPGKGFVEGYHFKVIKEKQTLFFGIYGHNKDGNLKTWYMNNKGTIMGSATKND
ncbi:hypothetical protein DFQ01_108150 [Paenibacillus cellulosilyticus]|uniref:Uncharacterized protein n=1 Tax=Paenibacillus cellulosilyticus TaxID=375489 RepID=A0A2V2YTQ9_9BACL|nr:hypothetical protein [Paenibacillus cellulosilyticus]PWW02873.1 hypothetical protein DFQ01_108150 [Paenibacillus cellulosilyticus]QKS45787.1 hypothetical protein HUB94_16075 [Paenibacillus cellulosilyticus]